MKRWPLIHSVMLSLSLPLSPPVGVRKVQKLVNFLFFSFSGFKKWDSATEILQTIGSCALLRENEQKKVKGGGAEEHETKEKQRKKNSYFSQPHPMGSFLISLFVNPTVVLPVKSFPVERLLLRNDAFSKIL